MIYELREYVAAPGRADALHLRFAEGTLSLFDKHRLDTVGFWTDREDAGRIVYLLRFPDEETRVQRWAAFQSDPDWKQLKAASETGGPIVAEMRSLSLTSPAYWLHETTRELP
ncbi:NIPSNAP family protein [Streptomyces melanosporofaciens]|uniref:NIPSNAP protein n=1 Tax=Streptomyces melanosporofaciens TaxID=67327 RepID=A0A1H4KKK6_STRMJ|nr:NIPSNAP family protein [Streptomyces melanosporofaciens]SEB59060.1 NIPSNAP protein [Streptomyces melanosporofaciens]